MKIELKRICVPTDFSEFSQHALRYGLTFAQQFSAQLHLLHVVEEIIPSIPEPNLAVWPTDEVMRSLETGAAEGLEKLLPPAAAGNLDVVRVVRRGSPFREITEYAKENQIDLLVLATHGRSGLAHFLLGSVVERIIRSSPCPVLTIRHPEHDFVL